mmetsp:Transcript_5221/g.6723  ORF Transcript_5221/g.6723 Transcript_5221/m.6723 type:complete len:317 (+) Transcript_5221:23-973(+)
MFRSANEAMNCIVLNKAGVSYEDLTCLYPRLQSFYTKWEMEYDCVAGRDWMRSSPWLPFLAVALYGIFIVWGKAAMKSSKEWNWRSIMAFWNLSLSTFSWMGLIRTLPHLIHNMYNYSLEEVFCNDPESAFGSGSTGLWVQLFILSKFPELIDTFFIVIHKKPLIFLHWYHHVTVLLYCWHSYVSSAPTGLFFVVMNYAVHAIMYGYYFLMAVGMKPKWLKGYYITAAQITQMIAGVAVTILSFYYYNKYNSGSGRRDDKHDGGGTNKCYIQKENNTAAFVMYGSYLFLFLQFFVGRYTWGNLSKRKRTAMKKKQN